MRSVSSPGASASSDAPEPGTPWRDRPRWVRWTTYVSVVVVALGDLDEKVPDLSTAAAFLFQPGDLIAIGRGVWQVHFLPLGTHADFTVITARRDPEQDRDLVDLGREAGVVLEVALGQPTTTRKDSQ